MSQPIPLVFPIQGLHEGVGYDIQPPGTSGDVLNVRGYDALKQRLRGGRRSGLSKFIPGTVDVNGGTVQVIERAVFANEPEFTADPQDDDFSAYAVSEDPDFLGNWVAVHREAHGTPSSEQHPMDTDTFRVTTGPKRVQVDLPGAAGNIVVTKFLLPLYPTDDEMECEFYATPAGNEDDDGVDRIGIMFRATIAADRFCGVIWERFNNTAIDLQPFFVDGEDKTDIGAALGRFTVSGGASPADGLIMRVTWDATGFDVYVEWQDEVGSDAKWAGTSYRVESTKFAELNGHHAGPCIGPLIDIADKQMSVIRCTYTRLVPNASTIAHRIVETDDDLGLALQYELPNGWSHLASSSAGVVSGQHTGPLDSASSTGFQPCIDVNNSQLVGGAVVSSNGTMTVTQLKRTVPEETRYAVEIRTADDGRGSHGAAAMFAVAESGLKFLYTAIRFNPTSKDDDSSVAQVVSMSASLRINGVNTHLFKYDSADAADSESTHFPGMPILHTGSSTPTWLRISFDGENLTYSINGSTWFVHTLTEGQIALLDAATTERCAISGDEVPEIRLISFDDLPPYPISDRLVVVSDGTLSIVVDQTTQVPTGGETIFSPNVGEVMLQAAYNKVFGVDGSVSKVYRYATNDVIDWTASTAGTLPEKARLVALYRGRLVLAGLAADPHNWFMSRLGDPFDWDYAPAVIDATIPVAGNNSETGLIGDIITALIPIHDDLMLIGGDSTIWKMSGDPAAGGTIDAVSDRVGIAFGRAWVRDPDGMLYFYGGDGAIYRLASDGSPPENMVAGRIDRRFRSIDLKANRVFLEWNPTESQLIVLIYPMNGSTICTVYIWDKRTDSWWQDEYPTTIGPSVIRYINGISIGDQVLLYGSRDGYLRQYDHTAAGDDGNDILSRVRYAPYLAPDGGSEVILTGISPTLAQNSGFLDVSVYTGQTAEECAESTVARIKRRIAHAGRNHSIRQPVRGMAVQVEVSQTGQAAWAMEKLMVNFDPSGPPRKEVKARGS